MQRIWTAAAAAAAASDTRFIIDYNRDRLIFVASCRQEQKSYPGDIIL